MSGQDPYEINEVLAQPPQSWPLMDTAGERAAYLGWSNLLCGCSDYRAKYADGEITDDATLLSNVSSVPVPAGVAPADWTNMGSELKTEQQWAAGVQQAQQAMVQLTPVRQQQALGFT